MMRFCLKKIDAVLLLLIALFIFTLVRDKYDVFIIIVAALLATCWKSFRDSIEEYFIQEMEL